MADIAVIFHWSPEDMGKMTLSQLLVWHTLALERAELVFGAKVT
ncbi:MAG: GpE family phage tail protein [Pseudomonadota bacterium]